MKVILDECLPRKLKSCFEGYEVATVPEMSWAGRKNGALVRQAEMSFDVFVTADQNIQYQQNLCSISIRMIVMVAPNNQFETLLPLIPKMLRAMEAAQSGDMVIVGR